MSTTPTRRKPSWVVPLAILTITALLIALVVNVNQGQNGASSEPQQSGAAEVHSSQQPKVHDAELREEGDLLTAGPVDAPVVLVVFSDYQCPYCAKWNKDTLPTMMSHAEAGDLRIEWRDINVLGPASKVAARAAHAAAQQDAFWEYHDALFAEGERRPKSELSEKALTELAKEQGLDVDRFTTDMASEETAQVVARNERLGVELGATSTPVFTLGGQPIVGAQPTGVFTQAFDDALAEAE